MASLITFTAYHLHHIYNIYLYGHAGSCRGGQTGSSVIHHDSCIPFLQLSFLFSYTLTDFGDFRASLQTKYNLSGHEMTVGVLRGSYILPRVVYLVICHIITKIWGVLYLVISILCNYDDFIEKMVTKYPARLQQPSTVAILKK